MLTSQQRRQLALGSVSIVGNSYRNNISNRHQHSQHETLCTQPALGSVSSQQKTQYATVSSSVADSHRKNADADPGKNLNADADPDADADSCSY
jgi:hypothetical protein